jgi:dTDP-4-amino-4,6-dideoxygalactose transaminase
MYRNFESAREGSLPVATDRSNRILCLPIFDSLSDDEFANIIDVIVTANSENL